MRCLFACRDVRLCVGAHVRFVVDVCVASCWCVLSCWFELPCVTCVCALCCACFVVV